MISYRPLLTIGMALLLAACSGEPVEQPPTQSKTLTLSQPVEVADFRLETQEGIPFGTHDLLGHWNYLFFGFTHCPHICPTSLAVLAKAEKRIRALPGGDQFRGLFISVDPERDDGPTIASYLVRFSAAFVGLRGDPSETLKLARNVDVAFATLPDGQGGFSVEHSSQIVLIDPDGRYRGLIRAPHEADALVSAYRQLAL